MGKLNLHIANANKKFTKSEVADIESAAISAEKFINNNFDFDFDVDLIVTTPSFLLSTIAEDGISGRTYSSQLIILVIDKEQKKISESFVFETICHEMSHSLRWEKLPEYSRTLFDGVILEGLAVVLEEKAMETHEDDEKQFFIKEVQGTSKSMIDSIISYLGDSMQSEQFDYDTIFYNGNDTIPRWAGYRLGYYFVKKHLKESGSTIFEATLDSYSKFRP